MSLRDRDLISIQEARELAARAAAAQKKFAEFSQEQVDAIVEACAKASAENAEPLARAAVEETGFGNVPDKIIKNTLAAVHVPRAIRGMRTVGILREDREKGIVEVASPIGVVAAIIPSTNPTSTAIYKTLISIKARNAIVLSPHPSAIKCICRAATVLERASLAAGAPEGLIQCMQHTTLEGTRELMRRPEVGVILATGGTGLVRAAYGSGKPAYGVGPGNVPAFIERTADVRKAVADIIAGKTFDYGTICSSEQAIVVEESVRESALEECRKQGGYFLSAEEIKKVSRLVFVQGSRTPNTEIVGRAATVIAEMAGIKVPPATRVLIARLEPDQVGRDFPLSAEKLSPILALYAVANFAAGVALCRRLLEFGGLGHTCSIHSQNRAAILEFGEAMPAFRVVVDSASVHGSIGYSTNLFPAMTLGCGAPGGNITSDNIGPQHLMNVKRIAWEARPVEHRTVPADLRMAGAANSAAPEAVQSEANMAASQENARGSAPVAAAASLQSKPEEKKIAVTPPEPAPVRAATVDRAAIARVVESVLASQGITRGSDVPAGSPVPAAATNAPAAVSAPVAAKTPVTIAAEIADRYFGARTKVPEGAAKASLPAQVSAPPACPPETGRNGVAADAAKKTETPATAAIEIQVFVSENDVRRAMTRSEKIYIGRKTILTPSARDLGMEHDMFVETETGSIR
ncbi:MAG TPA: aldehyde dehydrogenase family protein [Candidatus Acidoferrales bacterium]|nr:aldehyde dehydrogenase family protein [Candidatus Acidoferrales bacterium]